MALAIDIMHGSGPNNELRHQLWPKKTKVVLTVLAINIAAKGILFAVNYYEDGAWSLLSIYCMGVARVTKCVVTAKEELGEAILVVDIAAKVAIQYYLDGGGKAFTRRLVGSTLHCGSKSKAQPKYVD